MKGNWGGVESIQEIAKIAILLLAYQGQNQRFTLCVDRSYSSNRG